jgi:pimeloyl-ACP methyl ester carboxylesterase
VLVGHSYGGAVVSGVAEQMPEAIGCFVFLDAFVPENGESVASLTTRRQAIEELVQKGETSMKPVPAAVFQVNENDRAWVDRMCTPHPLATLTDKPTLTGARNRVAKKAYIRAVGYANPPFDAARDKLKATAGWRIYEVPCGHDVMVDMPDRLTEILLEVA